MAARPIRIAIIANASQAKRELGSIAGETRGLGSTLGKVGKLAAAGLAVAGTAAVAFGVSVAKSASDAQQSLGATETVFGKFAQKVIKTSDAAAQKYGLSANSYRENANLIGSLFRNQGVAVDQLAGKTESMIGKAADLSATFGGTATEAVEALSSAFKGEFDPLERYGISLKQSTVNAEASTLAQKKYGKSLEDLTGAQQTALKQQATTNIINKQSARSQGAFARETNTLAHQQQVLAAQFDNVKAKIGSALLPVLTRAFSFINTTVIPGAEKLGAALRDKLAPFADKAKKAFADLKDKLKPVGDFFKNNPEVIKGVGIALGIAAAAAAVLAIAMGAVALATSPITLTVLAIAALGGAIAYAYKHSETFRNGIAAVGQIAQQVFGWLQTNVGPILAALGEYYAAAFGRIKQVTSTVLSVIQGLWKTFGGTILRFLTSTFNNLKTVVQGGLKVIKGVIQVVTGIIKGDWSKVWTGIKTILSGAWGIIKGVVSQGVNVIKTLMSLAWTALKSITSAAWTGIKTAVSKAISGVISLVKSLPGKITGALGDLGSLLTDAGKKIIQGLIDGIGSMFGAVQDKLGDLTGKLTSWKGPPKKDAKLLRPAGRLIIQGLIDGFEDGEGGVKKSLGKITDLIKKSVTGKNEAKREAAVLKSFKDEYAALLQNGRAQDKLNSKLESARDRLKELKQAAADYAQGVKDSFQKFGSVVGLGQLDGGTVSIDNLIDQLKQRAVASQRFGALIRELTAQGLSQGAIQQIVDAGVDGGLATAEAIASGGQAAIDQINALQAEIASQGGQLGRSLADQFQGAGIAAAEGLVKGLEKQAKQLDRAAERMADALVRKVKRALGINSPSKVFRGVGDNVVKGLVIGLDDYRVQKQAASIATSLEKGFGEPALQAFASVNGAGAKSGDTVNINVSVPPTANPAEVGREIASALDSYYASGGRRRAG